MPVVRVEENYTPTTYNTEDLSDRLLSLWGSHFGAERVIDLKPVMTGEDFGQFWLADQTKESVLFWVGGVPQAKWDETGGDTTKLPSLHSPFWAPDAEVVISTATEAMTVAAFDLLKTT